MRAALTLPPAGRVLLHLLLLGSVWTLLLAATASAAADHQIPEDLPPDDGSGPDDEDMSDLFGGVVHSDVTFRCYKCTGVMNQSGCNMTSFNQDPSDFITECSGHCLNISTADSTVFECTPEVPTKEAACFTKGGMKMCFCSTELCNGFPVTPALVLPASQRETGLVTSQRGDDTGGHDAATTTSRKNETVLTPPQLHDSDIVVAPGGTPQRGEKTPGVMSRKDNSSTSQDKEDNTSLTSREIEKRLMTSLRGDSRGNNVTFPEPSLHRQTNNNTYIQAGGSTSGADLVVRVCTSFSLWVTAAWGVHYNWLG